MQGTPHPEPENEVGRMAIGYIQSFMPSARYDKQPGCHAKPERRGPRKSWCTDCFADLIWQQKNGICQPFRQFVLEPTGCPSGGRDTISLLGQGLDRLFLASTPWVAHDGRGRAHAAAEALRRVCTDRWIRPTRVIGQSTPRRLNPPVPKRLWKRLHFGIAGE